MSIYAPNNCPFMKVLFEEHQKTLETLEPEAYAVLKACVDVNWRPKKERKATKKRSKCRTSSNNAILGVCVCAAWNLVTTPKPSHEPHPTNNCNDSQCRAQFKTGNYMYQLFVSCRCMYTRLQKLNLSLSRQCTLHEIGKEYNTHTPLPLPLTHTPLPRAHTSHTPLPRAHTFTSQVRTDHFDQIDVVQEYKFVSQGHHLQVFQNCYWPQS